MTKKYLLFDLDGTLLDTTEGIIESVRYTIRQLGLPCLQESELYSFIGPPVQLSFTEHYGLTQLEAQNAANIFRDYYKNEALLKAMPYPKVLEMMRDLKSKGFKLAVATYKREDYALTILHHFGFDSCCDVVHGADNFNKLTKSDIIHLCLDDLGAVYEQTVLIGDTKFDALGAQEAGIDFLGVTYGFGFKSKQEVDVFPNVGCAKTVEEIKAKLCF